MRGKTEGERRSEPEKTEKTLKNLKKVKKVLKKVLTNAKRSAIITKLSPQTGRERKDWSLKIEQQREKVQSLDYLSN
mgnify:CR=1 FL=1